MPFGNWIKYLIVFLLGLAAAGSRAQVRINEIFADNREFPTGNGSVTDWVELYNSSDQPVNLSNYSLTDNNANARKWVFPANVIIPARGYLVILLDANQPPSAAAEDFLNAGFALDATGERIELYSPAGALLDSVRFGPQAANFPIGRIPNGTGNFALTTPNTPGAENAAQATGPQNALRINEWMASPTAGKDWFEIYNPSPNPVPLSGLYFTDNGNSPSPVAPLSFIGAGLFGYLRFFADNSTNDNEVNFALGAGGDEITLFAANGAVIDRVAFGQQTADRSEGRLPDGADTRLALNTATPGQSNFVRYEGLYVNELLSHTDPPFEDAVEFYNATLAPIDLSGWYLSNNRTDLRRYRVPAGTTIAARGYIVIYENQFNGPAAAIPFTFNSARGDQVYLAQANAADQLTGFLVEETFGPSENGVSFGRVETSAGEAKFVAMTQPTFGVSNPQSVEQFRAGRGQPNSAPRVGPVVINEIMYNPQPPAPGVDNTLDEFIELLNISGQPVQLYDPAHPENRWVLRDAVGFTFPPFTTLPASAHALVVSFDPSAQAATLNAFRAKFNVPASVQIFGPYSGKLSNAGDAVELYKPDPPQLPPHPDAGLVPYIRVDKIDYFDAAPWPPDADGTGKSLQRKNPAVFGNDPVNWQAAAPTAGRSNSAEVADADGDGLPDGWERDNGFNPNDPADASLDADSDGFTNLQEYVSGTNPRDAGSRLALAEVRYVENSEAVLTFQSVAGKSYSVQYRNNLLPSTIWQKLVSTNAADSSMTIRDAEAAGRAQRFYRVVTPALD